MIPTDIVSGFINTVPRLFEHEEVYWSRTRDVFEARLQAYNLKKQNWLFGAVLGEIGFNTFDHNFVFPDVKTKGLYCDFEYSDGKYVILLDFGKGLKASLFRVRSEIVTDYQAIEVAFTEQVSGRMPEQRGNGLKFVLSTIISSGWEMYYHSGNAVCIADKNGYSFEESCFIHNGCFCILGIGGE